MDKYGFTVVQNSGKLEKFTNSCMFVSILQYLKLSGKGDYTLNHLREIARFPGKKNEMFDIAVRGHTESLIRLLTFLEVSLDVYYCNETNDQKWIMQPAFSFNSGFQTFAIVSYVAHFELIVSQTLTTEEIKYNGRTYEYVYDPNKFVIKKEIDINEFKTVKSKREKRRNRRG